MRFASWRSARARSAVRGFLAIVLAAVPVAAAAATFYKWVEKDGTVHYGDAPPKGFKGEVTRVEVDPGAHTVAPGKAPPALPAPPEPARAGEVPAPPPDLLTQRRETRARLEANLAQARERLDLARKALAEAGNPQEDEWQYTVGGSPGPGPHVAMSNCHKTTDGKTICPGRVPSAEYYSRVQQLEDQVKRAEQAVEEAERAYRRGVD
jgi:hypothetical protein